MGSLSGLFLMKVTILEKQISFVRVGFGISLHKVVTHRNGPAHGPDIPLFKVE